MPAATTWKYLENQFEVRTRNSRPLMDKQVQKHDAALKAAAGEPGADPVLVTLRDAFAAPKTQWDTDYSEWKNAGATREGRTVSLETLLRNLAVRPGPEQESKIEAWDNRIRVEAPRGSALYETLLPQGRKPFSEGGRAAIINEVKNLGLRLAGTGNANLVTLGTQVTAYYTLMRDARSAQQGAEGTTDEEAADVNDVRVTIATELYGNLGTLMALYKKNPLKVAGFFDLESLRRPADQEEDAAATTNPTP